MKRLAHALWLSASLSLPTAGGEVISESTVGMPTRIRDLVLPGGELEVINGDNKAAVALRIIVARPHGDAFRYELEFWGLDAGEHDLRPFLRRKDGSTTADLPELGVAIRSVLATPGIVPPHAPNAHPLPTFGGYRTWMIVGAVVWVGGLIALLVAGRKRRDMLSALPPRPRTLAEHLKPLVERAMRGELSREERSQLEMSLVAYWRRKLALELERPSDVLRQLKRHAEAGPLLQQLEDWLHKPEPARDVDWNRLLAPYRELPADALEPATPAGWSGAAR